MSPGAASTGLATFVGLDLRRPRPGRVATAGARHHRSHTTTTQRAAARGTWSRYVTRRKAATVGAVPRKTSPAAAAASLAGGGRIHRDLNRPHPHDASAVKLRTMMAQLRPLPGVSATTRND
jgi:hypothetical protein